MEVIRSVGLEFDMWSTMLETHSRGQNVQKNKNL